VALWLLLERSLAKLVDWVWFSVASYRRFKIVICCVSLALTLQRLRVYAEDKETVSGLYVSESKIN